MATTESGIELEGAADGGRRDISLEADGAVRVTGWFPNDGREVWVKVTVEGKTYLRRLELPKEGPLA